MNTNTNIKNSFLFSAEDLKTISPKEIVTIVDHIHSMSNENFEVKCFYESFYFKILEQCNPVTAIIGISNSNNEKEDSCLYLFEKEKEQLKFIEVNHEEKSAFLQDEFPIDLIFKNQLLLVKNSDQKKFLKEFSKAEFECVYKIENYFKNKKMSVDGVSSFIGQSLGQTWTFYTEFGETFYLHPQKDKSSQAIFWKKKKTVPISFLFELSYISFYNANFSLYDDISGIIYLQKLIFEMINLKNKNIFETNYFPFLNELEKKPLYIN